MGKSNNDKSFRAFVQEMPDTYWARYDLSAVRIGWDAQQIKLDILQSGIDSLMFEYCPEEMTEEQRKNWEQHQVVSPLTVLDILS